MTIKGGTSPACAACKYQRRKCSSDCILAPYFPANQPKVFQNVHRLYGVSKIMKILKELETTEQKDDALTSIKYESDMREKFPVYGCLGVIIQLREQYQAVAQELNHVYAQIASYKEQSGGQIGVIEPNHPFSSQSLHFNIAPPSNEMSFINGSTSNNNYFPKDVNYGFDFSRGVSNDFSRGVLDDPAVVFSESGHDNVTKPLLDLHLANCDSMTSNNYSLPVQEQLVSSDVFGIQQETDVSHQFENMMLHNIVDDSQSYIETPEACESSSN